MTFEGKSSGSDDSEVNVAATQERIDRYRAAANGQCDIHQFTVGGEVQREVTTAPGEAVDPAEMEHSLVGYDADGSAVPATYEGVLSPDACTALADSLAVQIANL